MRWLRVTLMIGLGGLALSCVGVASARQDAFDTRITIHEPTDFSYGGRVFSKSRACVRHRTVEFWRRTSGPDELLDTQEATKKGKWHFEFVGEHYYAVAVREKVGPHDKVCREDRSPTT